MENDIVLYAGSYVAARVAILAAFIYALVNVLRRRPARARSR